jgi:phosphoglycolate phosphatase
MNIFFDLDGTLVDARNRLYLLFQHLVTGSKFSFDEYWNLKRDKISHKEILQNQFSYSSEEIRNFERTWLQKIETTEWLACDQPFPGVTEFLIKLKEEHTIFVVTARQFEVVAKQQLAGYGWSEIFERVLVTGQRQEKYSLIDDAVKTSDVDWFVGDTGKDIQTGKKLGMKTAAVLSGFMNRERLVEYSPDIIVGSILELEF